MRIRFWGCGSGGAGYSREGVGARILEGRKTRKNEIPPLLYLFVVCCLLIASILFSTPKSFDTPKTRVLKYGGEVEHKRGEGETVRLMATEERVFHFQTYCILVQNNKNPFHFLLNKIKQKAHVSFKGGVDLLL